MVAGRGSDEADLAESFSLVPHSGTWMLCNKEQNRTTVCLVAGPFEAHKVA